MKTCYVAGADKSIKEAWNRIRREFSQFRACHPQFGNCKFLYRSSAQDTANEKRTLINRLVTPVVGLSMVEMKGAPGNEFTRGRFLSRAKLRLLKVSACAKCKK